MTDDYRRRAMTVQIEFRRDHLAAASVGASDPAVLFGETLLIVPVRFSVDGHELLPMRRSTSPVWTVDDHGTASEGDPVAIAAWTEQPVVGFLGQLRRAVETAATTGRASAYLTDLPALRFTLRQNQELEVVSPATEITVAAPLSEIADAVATFQAAVRLWLEQVAPQINTHPSWTEWFPPSDLK